MNPHLSELIALLRSHDVEFLVVGSACLALYARPRYTEDIDLWVRNTAENVDRLASVLKEFGLPADREALSPFVREPRQLITLGAAPSAVDMLNFLDGLTFDEAWLSRVTGTLEGIGLQFLSFEHFVRSKRASGRPKDLADLALLAEVRGQAMVDAVE